MLTKTIHHLMIQRNFNLAQTAVALVLPADAPLKIVCDPTTYTVQYQLSSRDVHATYMDKLNALLVDWELIYGAPHELDKQWGVLEDLSEAIKPKLPTTPFYGLNLTAIVRQPTTDMNLISATINTLHNRNKLETTAVALRPFFSLPLSP